MTTALPASVASSSAPASEADGRRHPSRRLGLGERLLRRLLERLERGSLEVVLPDGRERAGRGAEAGPAARVVLHRWRALRRLLLEGDLGFAEAYLEGDWSSPDLVALLELAARQGDAFTRETLGTRAARWLARAMHRLHDNTRRGSRGNIAAHYDLGNAFFAAWLDAGMQYSSALYAEDDADRDPDADAVVRGAGATTLEAAQQRKLAAVMDLLAVQPGQRVLEIGCGWGAVARAIAAQGAHVTGLTLSREQRAWAIARGHVEGLADRLDLRLQDYRDVEGRYDRLVSIEMIEAVGEAWWPTWFSAVAARLAPKGHAVVQAITIDEAVFPDYRRGADFIQRHVFPGGMLPTVTALGEQAAAQGLVFTLERRFGASYARTLAEWRDRFEAAWPRIAPLGFDERFRRLWRYYLCYCEAGFRTGRIDVVLGTLRHAGGHGPAARLP